MTEQDLYRLAYNAHEWAEEAALEAMREKLSEASLEALTCLADPKWGWANRSFLSLAITDAADVLLTEKQKEFVAMCKGEAFANAFRVEAA